MIKQCGNEIVFSIQKTTKNNYLRSCAFFCWTVLSLSRHMCVCLPSLKTSYASEISLNLLFASSKLSGFLSGCHFNASFLYLWNENMPDITLAKLVKNTTGWSFHKISELSLNRLQRRNPWKKIDEESMNGLNLRLFDISATRSPLYFEHLVVIDHRSTRSRMNQDLGNHLSDNTRESIES